MLTIESTQDKLYNDEDDDEVDVEFNREQFLKKFKECSIKQSNRFNNSSREINFPIYQQKKEEKEHKEEV